MGVHVCTCACVCIVCESNFRQGTAKMVLLYTSSTEQEPRVISLHMAKLFFKSLPNMLAGAIMNHDR